MTPTQRRARENAVLPEEYEEDELQRVSAPRVRVGEDSLAYADEYDDELDETPPWAEKLVRFLDDGIRVPGTDFRFGADGIIGFFLPGVGDAVTGMSSVALLFLAFKERVPTIALGRMVINILIDTVFGSVPVIGDFFDILFKANRKNLDMIEKYRDVPDLKPTVWDYILVVGGTAIALFGIVLPFLLIWLASGVLQ